LCSPAGFPGASGVTSANAWETKVKNPSVKTVANFITTSSVPPPKWKAGNQRAFHHEKLNRRIKRNCVLACSGYFPVALFTVNATATALPSDRLISTGTLAPIFNAGVGSVHIR
jgi:hypothetical protein